jgi:hypothetical protein
MNSFREDGVVKVDNAELSTVKIVGSIDSLEEHSTNFNFKINDFSGVVDCKLYIEKESGLYSRLARIR